MDGQWLTNIIEGTVVRLRLCYPQYFLEVDKA